MEEQPKVTLNWKAIGLGVIVVGLLGSVFFFRRLFCYYTFEIPLVNSWLTILLGVIAGLFGNLAKGIDTKGLKSVLNSLAVPLIIVPIVILVSPMMVSDLSMNFCVANFDELVALIDQEGNAVLHKDMDSIEKIYWPGAVVSQADTNSSWPALIYYSQKLAREKHCFLSHADYTVTKYSSDTVHISTSSMGTFGAADQGCDISYANRPGADQWVFTREDGEWRIYSFSFNNPVP